MLDSTLCQVDSVTETAEQMPILYLTFRRSLYCYFPFLAEDSNCIAKFSYCHNMLSVCLSVVVCNLSVTPVYCDEMAEVRITRFSLESSELA